MDVKTLSRSALRAAVTGTSLTVVLLVGTRAANAADFEAGCPLPYAKIAAKKDNAESCEAEGSAPNAQLASEYKAKNMLCASDPATDITFNEFLDLQKAIEGKPSIPTGDRGKPIPDRGVLKHVYKTAGGKEIGEGTRVRTVAYILGAKATGTSAHSDGTAGEGVNCNVKGAAENDIHIDVAAEASAKACDGVVAEMIPHFRPTKWNPTNLNKLKGVPVRIVGHLFLDSRHKLSTCANPSTGDPPRSSLWEIHPVYALDVCKYTTLSKCAIGDDGAWIAFDQWLGTSAAGKAHSHPAQPARQHQKGD